MDMNDFICEMLSKLFPGERQKHDVRPTKTGFNFTCPYCGATIKHVHKKRGNVYVESGTFKCFNDGCMKWLPLNEFVGEWARRLDIDISDLDVDFGVGTERYSRPNDANINDISQFLERVGAIGTMPTIDYLSARFSLFPITAAAADSGVRDFCDRRGLYDVPNVASRIFADRLDKAIYIMNVRDSDGRVLSYATRSVREKKYNVVPYSHYCEKLRIQKIEDHWQFVDSLGEYYNLLNVNLNSNIYVTEGQIDSMFMRNAIAVQGISKSMSVLDDIPFKNVFTMFDNDEAGRGAAMRELRNGRRAFMWSLVISDIAKRGGSRHDIRKIKDTNDLYIYMRKNYGMRVAEFSAYAEKFFSTSKYDMLYV